MIFGLGKMEKEREQTERNKAERAKAEHEQYLSDLERKAESFVFTVSASDYAKNVGRDLQNYELRFVSARDRITTLFSAPSYGGPDVVVKESALAGLVKEGIKIGAEAIVDVKPSYDASHDLGYLMLIGTALIPKKP